MTKIHCKKCGTKKRHSNKSLFCSPCAAELRRNPVFIQVSRRFYAKSKNGSKALKPDRLLLETLKIITRSS